MTLPSLGKAHEALYGRPRRRIFMRLRFTTSLRRPTALRSRVAIAVVAAALLAPTFAAAQEAAECQDFAWSLTRERAWFGAQNLPVIESGGNAPASGAAILNLRPMADVVYAQPPERQPKTPGAFGAILAVAAPGKPGLYQVTLSDGAWVDVVQDGARLKTAAHTGKKGCPGLRKSLRFEVKAAPLTIQISGASVDRLSLAIAPADER